MAQENVEALELLLHRGCLAEDRYYLEMDDAAFAELAKEDAELHEVASLQRAQGFENFQTQLRQDVMAIDDTEDLHFLANEFNFEDDPFLLECIIEHPLCDLKTARLIYWLSEPLYYYDQYGRPARCSKNDDSLRYAQFLNKLEDLARRGVFKSHGIEYDADTKEMLAELADVDFSRLPYSAIPQALHY